MKTNPRPTPSPRAARVVDSPIGRIYLAATETGLTHVLFVRGDDPEPSVTAGPGAAERVLDEAEKQLADYFAHRRREFELPLAPAGTAFQLATWQALRSIPYGKTLSYAELARRIGKPRAVRAVGAANGANPISIVVPCHRVIGADGTLVGYGGGLETKRFLLSLEGYLPLA